MTMRVVALTTVLLLAIMAGCGNPPRPEPPGPEPHEDHAVSFMAEQDQFSIRVYFRANATPADGATYAWQFFRDGAYDYEQGANASYNYTESGPKTVTLTALWPDGHVATDSKRVAAVDPAAHQDDWCSGDCSEAPGDSDGGTDEGQQNRPWEVIYEWEPAKYPDGIVADAWLDGEPSPANTSAAWTGHGDPFFHVRLKADDPGITFRPGGLVWPTDRGPQLPLVGGSPDQFFDALLGYYAPWLPWSVCDIFYADNWTYISQTFVGYNSTRSASCLGHADQFRETYLGWCVEGDGVVNLNWTHTRDEEARVITVHADKADECGWKKHKAVRGPG